MSWNYTKYWISFSSAYDYWVQRYWPFRVDDAANFLSSVEDLRPGDPNAPYDFGGAECNTETDGAPVACVYGMNLAK